MDTTPGTATKRCEQCDQRKPLDAFPKHGKARDGHMRICSACCKQYGFNSRSKKRPLAPVRSAPPVLPLAPVAPAIAPLFVSAGPYRFGLSSIALVDTSRPGAVDVKLNIHEVGSQGFPEALSFTFEGSDAALLLAALNSVTAQGDAEIEALRALVKQAQEERDTALRLAEELEQKQKALRQALGA